MSVKTLRLLLIEDNDTDVLVVREVLRDSVSTVFDFSHVNRLQSGLRLLAKHSFDIILLDLSLPDSEGIDTFLQVRSAVPNLPVVVVSHLADENIAIQSVQAGAQDYLVKGNMNGMLVRTILYAIERAQTQKAFRTSEERLNAVVESVMDGIISIDQQQHIVVFNAAAKQMFGYSAKDILGQPIDRLIPQIFRAGHIKHIDAFSAAGTTARAMGEQLPLSAVRADGEEFPVEISISKVMVNHQPLCTAIVRDLTAATLVRMELEAANKRLKHSMAALEHMVHYDALTGLPNRVYLSNHILKAIDRCLYNGKSLAVAFIDLDAFKSINDAYGHEIGEDLLVAVAQRMESVLRDGDCLARIGGDEFVVVLVDLDNADTSKPLLNALLHSISSLTSVKGTTMKVTASIGVTIYPQDGTDKDLLIRHADQAMYLAKQAGRNRIQLFDTQQATALADKQKRLLEVRHGIKHNEFMLYYQPKVNMHTGNVEGLEALIRWQHPELGFLSPLDFLPLINDLAISIELGAWVISTALTQITTWHNAGLKTRVSVNIGGLQLQQEDFVEHIEAALKAHAMPVSRSAQPSISPVRLDIEVVESSALQDIEQVCSVMQACQALGVHFAIDDFGTGYSSLTYLRRLPAELLKIDQSFVRNMLTDSKDLEIVKGVIGLAKAFGREVIAEGVESIAHGEMLMTLGCDLAQGYAIARPMPAEEVPVWVASWKPGITWSSHSGMVDV
jgi:diguanylate cyclase (GGDEF)-like protein/PAS domain S-box-containing protein